jgi:hypothetical protein
MAETVVDPGGNLRVPEAYRTTYQSLGSWAVAAGLGQTAYRRDLRFPDGAVLVKEVFQAAAQMTTGTVSDAEAPDARGRRPQATERSRP